MLSSAFKSRTKPSSAIRPARALSSSRREPYVVRSRYYLNVRREVVVRRLRPYSCISSNVYLLSIIFMIRSQTRFHAMRDLNAAYFRFFSSLRIRLRSFRFSAMELMAFWVALKNGLYFLLNIPKCFRSIKIIFRFNSNK